MVAATFNFAGNWPKDVNQKIIREVLDAAAVDAQISLPQGEITIKLVDDAAITTLNKQYTGNDYATDVLAFPYDQNLNAGRERELGDIAVSLDTAQRQADQAGTDITAELALLALHGVLHIAGLDHDTKKGSEQMNQIQRNILAHHKLIYREFGWQKAA